jgi:hypothetical protein
MIKLRLMRWTKRGCMGEMRNVYKMLAEKPEGKRPLENLMHRWQDITTEL